MANARTEKSHIEHRQMQTFMKLKWDTIRAARELMYDPIYISRLQNATTESELNRIMVTARLNSYERYE